MLKRQSKMLSIALIFVFCMSFMFAGFAAPDVASAANYSTSNAPVVSKTAGQTLGPVIIDFPILNAGYHKGIIKLPDGYDIDPAIIAGTPANAKVTDMSDTTGWAAVDNFVAVLAAPDGVANNSQYRLVKLVDNQLQFEIFNTNVLQKVKFAIVMSNITVASDADKEINATILKLNGDFSDSILVVGKTSAGAVDVLRTDPPTMQAGVSNLVIHIREDSAGALAQGTSTLKFKLPKGVTWTNTVLGAAPSVALFPGTTPLPGTETITVDISDDTVLKITRTSAAVPANAYTFTLVAGVQIDDETAAFGDVNTTVSGTTNSNMSSVKLGTYKDFGYTIKVDNPDKELFAGQGAQVAQTISKFTLKENIANSLLLGRTVTMTLPDGIEWNVTPMAANTNAGTLNLNNFVRSTNYLNKATCSFAGAQGAAGEWEFKDLEVRVAVDYVGPIDIQFSGSAGINDKITVGTVIAPISAKADLKEVKIGLQGQEAGAITITETQADAIKSRFWNTALAPAAWDQTTLTLKAPYGVTWDKLPTVKVIDGDLDLGTVTRGYDNNGKHQLLIPIRSASSKASTIEVTNVVFSVDRTVPEGALKISIGGNAVDQANIINRTTAATVVAATCVTPAPGETVQSGQFKISSNIYYVGGVAKVMDVAPYIKGDRTYVPMRYLGEMLGAEVVWDDAARTVTLTKGDDVVVFTIGSATYTVNGESKVADVAPEISQDRTMLPARFVAEAFGAQVGWDAGTRTVLIQK